VIGCGARIETVAAGQQPGGGGGAEMAAAGSLAVGDRVSCNWLGKGTFYDGRVGELRGANVYINYDDGDVEETSPGMCRVVSKAPASSAPPVARPTASSTAGGLALGDRVSCNWKGGGTFYSGRVGELRPGGRIFIQYDDGDVEETSPSMCRTQTMAVPVATPVASPFRPGDRVSCNWKNGGRYYDGSVGELRAGGRIFVRYDDGDVEETSPAACRSLQSTTSSVGGAFQPGDRVSCNWLGKGTRYSGRVAELRAGGRVFIQYDDGDQEETTPDMCQKL
jgi:hypothetical protein